MFLLLKVTDLEVWLGEGYCWEFVPNGRLVLTELGRMEASLLDKEGHIVQRKDEGWHTWCVW